MNGDGLKDIKVGTTFAQEETEPMSEAFLYQEESGLFYLESYRALVDKTGSADRLAVWEG